MTFAGEGPEGRQNLAGGEAYSRAPGSRPNLNLSPEGATEANAKRSQGPLSPLRGSVIIKQSHRGFASLTSGQILPALRACDVAYLRFPTQTRLTFAFDQNPEASHSRNEFSHTWNNLT